MHSNDRRCAKAWQYRGRCSRCLIKVTLARRGHHCLCGGYVQPLNSSRLGQRNCRAGKRES